VKDLKPNLLGSKDWVNAGEWKLPGGRPPEEFGPALFSSKKEFREGNGRNANVWLQNSSLPGRGCVGFEVYRCLCLIDAGNVFISTIHVHTLVQMLRAPCAHVRALRATPHVSACTCLSIAGPRVRRIYVHMGICCVQHVHKCYTCTRAHVSYCSMCKHVARSHVHKFRACLFCVQQRILRAHVALNTYTCRVQQHMLRGHAALKKSPTPTHAACTCYLVHNISCVHMLPRKKIQPNPPSG